MASLEVAQVVERAQELMTACEFDIAYKLLKEAKETMEKSLQGNDEYKKSLIEVLELLGETELELGLVPIAKEHFMQCLSLSESFPIAQKPASSHLNLAQLSEEPQESIDHYQRALTILKSRFRPYPTPGPDAEMQDDEEGVKELTEEEEEELESRQMAAKCLVGMTELYLTDLCFEPKAEEICEKYLLEAVSIYDEDPEVYQTLASVRLSQQRPEDAQQALLKSWSIWRGDDPTENPPPPFPSRIAMTRMLIELELYPSALEILDGLEQEDDGDAEVAYLKGWVWFLRGETWDEKSEEHQQETDEEQEEDSREPESKVECYEASLEALNASKKLNNKNPLEPDVLEHVEELIGTLQRLGIKPPLDADEEPDPEPQDVEMN